MNEQTIAIYCICDEVVKALGIANDPTEKMNDIVDSFPVKAYENHKSFRAKIFRGKEYHGYTASKKQYFFGIKVNMIVDKFGIPIEFCFTSGRTSDLAGLKLLPCELREGTFLFADKAYTDYALEEDLKEMAQFQLVPRRKEVHKKQHSQSLVFLLNSVRNRIETAFNSIISRMPRTIRASNRERILS